MTHRRRWTILAIVGVATAVAVVALSLFQPWELWVDDEVQEAAPAGAAPIVAAAREPADTAPAPSTPPPPTSPSAPPTTTVTTTPPPASTPAPATGPSTTTIPTTTIPTTVPPTTVPPTTVPPIPVGGQLTGIDHTTTGTVVVLQDAAGTQFVRIENLDTSNGPDLFVYLSTNPADGPEGQFDDDYVNLGRLQGNIGSANYVVPAGTDLFRFASVVIWCDRFDSAFGAAPLA